MKKDKIILCHSEPNFLHVIIRYPNNRGVSIISSPDGMEIIELGFYGFIRRGIGEPVETSDLNAFCNTIRNK